VLHVRAAPCVELGPIGRFRYLESRILQARVTWPLRRAIFTFVRLFNVRSPGLDPFPDSGKGSSVQAGLEALGERQDAAAFCKVLSSHGIGAGVCVGIRIGQRDDTEANILADAHLVVRIVGDT
jgi:hypothetical protein